MTFKIYCKNHQTFSEIFSLVWSWNISIVFTLMIFQYQTLKTSWDSNMTTFVYCTYFCFGAMLLLAIMFQHDCSVPDYVKHKKFGYQSFEIISNCNGITCIFAILWWSSAFFDDYSSIINLIGMLGCIIFTFIATYYQLYVICLYLKEDYTMDVSNIWWIQYRNDYPKFADWEITVNDLIDKVFDGSEYSKRPYRMQLETLLMAMFKYPNEQRIQDDLTDLLNSLRKLETVQSKLTIQQQQDIQAQIQSAQEEAFKELNKKLDESKNNVDKLTDRLLKVYSSRLSKDD